MSNVVGMTGGFSVLKEVSPNGKTRIRGYFIDPRTERKRSCTVTLDSDRSADLKKGMRKLESKIAEKAKEVSLQNPMKLTLAELAEKYVLYLATDGSFRPSTIKRNKFAVKRLCEILGNDTLVRKLPYIHVREILARTGESPGRLNERIKRLKAFMRWARNEGFIETIEWVDRIGHFKAESHREKIALKFLNQWEFRRVRDSMRLEHHKLFFEFLCLTGCRPGEAIALRLCDIDVVNREIFIDHSFDCQARQLTPTKNFNSKRVIDIQDELLELLKRIERFYARKDGKVKSPFLFHRKDGTPICEPTFNNYMKRICFEEIGRELTAHACRHTHTSLLAAQGYDLEFIARRLGHIDSDITRRVYLHVTDELRKTDRERIKHCRLG